MLKLLFYVFVAKFAIVTSEQNIDEVLGKFHQQDYKLRFDRSVLVFYDKGYYKQYNVKTFKYNRTQAACNTSYVFRVDIGNDLEILVQMYKLYSNEYRNFPIRMQVNFCSAINADVAGYGTSFLKQNPGCPLKKNVVYRIDNFFPDESHFPPLIPTGDFMNEMTMIYKNKNISVTQSYATVYRPIKF